MKNHWKTICLGALLALGMAFCMTACKNGPAATTPEASGAAASPAATLPETAATPSEPPLASPEASDAAGEAAGAARRAAYFAVLDGLLNRHVLPDGTDSGYDPICDAEGNQFAICDVDGDGRDELSVIYTTAPMAGQKHYLLEYDVDAEQLRTELCEYPLLTIYDNGVIKAGWSHNQGLAGEFWPYSLYQYDPASDSYAVIGMVDAWDKSFVPADFQGKPYPVDIDVSGAGVVYFLIPGGEYVEVTPVDAAVYDAWHASYVGDAAEIALPYVPLTQENLDGMR